MTYIILSPVTVLLYGIACWANYKKPAILKYVTILIVLWGVGTIFLLSKYQDAFFPSLPFSSRFYGMIIPLFYLLYLRFKGKNINESVSNDVSLMVATGFFFGVEISATFLFVYGVIFFMKRKAKLPYVVAIFPIVFFYYVIIIITIFIIIQSGNENPIPTPVFIRNP